MTMGSMRKRSGTMVGAKATDAGAVLLPTDEESPHWIEDLAVKTLLAVNKHT